MSTFMINPVKVSQSQIGQMTRKDDTNFRTAGTDAISRKPRSQLRHLAKVFRKIEHSLEFVQDNLKQDYIKSEKRLKEAEQNSCNDSNAKSHTFMEYSINNTSIGRLNFKLFDSEVPLTAENFRQLCTHKNVRFSYKKYVI